MIPVPHFCLLLPLRKMPRIFSMKSVPYIKYHAYYTLSSIIFHNVAFFTLKPRKFPKTTMERVRCCWSIRASHQEFEEPKLIDEIVNAGHVASKEEAEYLVSLSDAYLNTISLNALVSDEENSELEKFISSDDISVKDAIEQKSLRENLEYMLSTLKSREAQILRLRFGLDDGIERTLEDM